MKRQNIGFLLMVICFFLGFTDFLLSNFLIQTGYFREVNPFAYPYFLLIPMVLFFRVKDKFILYLLVILTFLLAGVVSINLFNLTVYLVII